MSFTAYKAFNRDGTCRGFQYEEGKTYELEGEPKLCNHGFHFCKDLVLTLTYYPITDCITDNLYAEVEVLGATDFEQPTRHKGCTTKMRITRFIPDTEVLELIDDHYNSGNSNSGNWNSGNSNSGNRNSGHWNSGHWNSGHWNSGNSNSGNWNSGNSNSGNRNSGHWNSGHWNSGHWNSGNSNSGNWNSGDSNSGNWNSGHWNSGHWNSGNSNSGNRNSGHWNSGHWNSGHWNSGFFNTDAPGSIRVFNTSVAREDWERVYKPSFLFFKIGEDETYKEAFKRSWDESNKEDRMRIKDLPNFDESMFFEISGIKVSDYE